MITDSTLSRRLLSSDSGLLTLALRLVLLPVSALYALAVTARNALYDAGLLGVRAVAAPVISVGNLTVGGTGKTPLVIALAQRAASEGRTVAIVTRGYGSPADPGGLSDEAALLAARCPGARVVVAPDRVQGARAAVTAGADLLLLDDGFQHRALHRDADIVMVDGREPFGNGSLLPAGPLREPASGIARATLVVLTHGESLSEGERQVAESAVRAHRLSIPLAWARHVPRSVRPVTGGPSSPPDSLAGTDVFLFCGIGSPEGFRATVEGLGARVRGIAAFGDHHAFRPEDLARVRAQARDALLLCTEKDAAKVARIPGHDDVLCLTVDLELEDAWPSLPGLGAPWTPRGTPRDGHGSTGAPGAH